MNTRNLAILHRRADVTPEEFQRYWLETHSGFVVRVPSVYRFGTNLVIESRVEGLQPDAMGELWWRTPEDSEIGFSIPEGQRALQSGHNIIDQPRNTGIALDRLEEFLPEGASEPRADRAQHVDPAPPFADVSAEEFERYWHEEHAPHVLELATPGVPVQVRRRTACAQLDARRRGPRSRLRIGETWWEDEAARGPPASTSPSTTRGDGRRRGRSSTMETSARRRNTSIALRELP